jgi:hypothetical protein
LALVIKELIVLTFVWCTSSEENVRPAHPSGLLFSFQGSVASGDFLMLALLYPIVNRFL